MQNCAIQNDNSWLILRKIINILVTRCLIQFGWGSAADPVWEAYSTPLDPLAGHKGGLLLRGERWGRGRQKTAVQKIP